MSSEKVRLIDLVTSFFKIGAFTFGGGLAMLPLIEREVIERRGWVEKEDILDIYALAQSVPGVIAVNSAMLIGYRLRGILGSIMAAVGVIAPSIFIIITIAIYFDRIMANTVAAQAMNGIRAAVAALIITATLKIGQRAIKDNTTGGIAIISFCLAAFTNINVVFIFVLCGWLGHKAYKRVSISTGKGVEG